MASNKKKFVSDFNEQQTFTQNLLWDIRALDVMIEGGMIESNIQRIGVEQELCFVDQFWRPAPIIEQALKKLNDEHFSYEHAKFNAEINTDPLIFEGKALSILEENLLNHLAELHGAAEMCNAQIALVGILPTIRKSDLIIENLTPIDRYQQLSFTQNQWKGQPYEVRIEGTDQLITTQDSTMLEGCNTSFQVHLQVAPDEFAKLYNWAQIISGPVLAACTNSPLLLGKRLWRETRIALFQQAIDTRNPSDLVTEEVPRVSFGNQWIKNSPLELFREDVTRHKILLHSKINNNALEQLESGQIPLLSALQLHNGTIYRWNRACYGITNNKPHLRIENRYLPAGPTIKDEIANAAFWLGLMKGIPDEYPNIPPLDFHHTKYNFIKAARMGLGAQFSWINKKRVTAKKLILEELLPMAKTGLDRAKIDHDDIEEYINIIKERVETERTGSQWILDSFNALKIKGTNYEALVDTTASMVDNQKLNVPVHKWKPAVNLSAGGWQSRFQKVNQIMSRDLFAVREDDILDLATNVMDWQHIKHVLVQNKAGQLTGVITSATILHAIGTALNDQPLRVVDVMVRNPITIESEADTEEALSLLIKNKIGCLPVLDKGVLVGIVTENDFMKILKKIIQELNKPSNEYLKQAFTKGVGGI